MKKNKIILFILALILLAGIILVCVKGFKVSLDLRAHDTLKFVFDQKFEMSDITKICEEVFKDKEYEIKTVEVFSDAIYIISPTITEYEEIALLEKLNSLYETEETSENEDEILETAENNETEDVTLENAETVENIDENIKAENATELTILDELEEEKYDFYHDSKIRIRDIVKPYIMPSVISALIIVVYMAIKYRKLNGGKALITVCKTLGEMLVILLEILSIVAIFRIPFTRTLVPIIMFIIVVCLCIRLAIYERQLKELEEE